MPKTYRRCRALRFWPPAPAGTYWAHGAARRAAAAPSRSALAAVRAARAGPRWPGCPWPKLDLKAVDQAVARSALSAMALKNDSGQGIAAQRSVTAV